MASGWDQSFPGEPLQLLEQKIGDRSVGGAATSACVATRPGRCGRLGRLSMNFFKRFCHLKRLRRPLPT